MQPVGRYGNLRGTPWHVVPRIRLAVAVALVCGAISPQKSQAQNLARELEQGNEICARGDKECNKRNYERIKQKLKDRQEEQTIRLQEARQREQEAQQEARLKQQQALAQQQAAQAQLAAQNAAAAKRAAEEEEARLNAPPAPPDPSVATARAKGIPLSVAGLRLGESLRLPKCNKANFATGGAAYMSITLGASDAGPRTCMLESAGLLIGWNLTLPTGEGEEEVAIHIAKDQCPDEVLFCRLLAATTTKGGVLRALVMSPGGDTLEHLRAKYGKHPGRTKHYTCQNQYGATDAYDEYEWNLPGVHIFFSSTGCQKVGSLLIETESHYAERRAAIAKYEKDKPKL